MNATPLQRFTRVGTGLVCGLGLAASASSATLFPDENISIPILRLRPAFSLHSQNGSVNGDDRATAVAVDSQDSILAAGSLTNARWTPKGTRINKDFVVTKYSWGGRTPQWTVTLQGGAYGNDEANAVTVDRQNNVIAAGYVTGVNSTGAVGGTHFTVAKWTPTGQPVWQRSLGGTYFIGANEAMDVAVDSRGDVVAAGFMTNATTDAAGNTVADTDFTVVKYDGATGNQVWRATIRGSRFGFTDHALSVKVDAQDNVVAGGFVRNSASGRDPMIVKWSPAGQKLWQLNNFGSNYGDDEVHSIAIDGGNNVAAAGVWMSQDFVNGMLTNHTDFWIARFTPNGGMLWSDRLQGTRAGAADAARSVAVDGQRNIVASGFITNTGTGQDFATMKWTPLGVRAWNAPRTLNGSANVTDRALSVAVNSAGTIVAGGFIENTARGRDYVMAKYDAAGNLIWNPVYNGTANGEDQCQAVALDSTGWAVSVGYTRNTNTGSDFVVAF